MKYKSELLSELIEKNGHTTTKVTHYESECENEFISEVRGAYPKLIDYSGEWLNYANNHVNIGKFPTERVENVTNARFENVVPYGCKSAILKGNTLVNKASVVGRTIGNDGWNNLSIKLNYPLSIKSKYLINIFNLPNGMNYVLTNSTNSDWIMPSYVNKKTVFASQCDSDSFITLHVNDSTTYRPLTQEEINKIQVIIIEYQEGMENWDIPYFEGMQSVKMPVLTTTGKNLFNLNKVIELEGLVVKNDSLHIGNRMFPDEVIYTFENAPTESILTFDISSTDVVNSGGALASIWYEDGTYSWITISNRRYVNKKRVVGVKIHNWCEGTHIISNIQLEEGISETPCEPFKTNILTVNEPVELRGIRDVQDTLDCLTGEVTSKIDEVLIDCNDYLVYGLTELDNLVRFYVLAGDIGIDVPNKEFNTISDKFISSQKAFDDSSDLECVHVGYKAIYFKLNKNRLSEITQNGVVNWFKSNPTTICWVANHESVKTVDLSCLDENNKPTKFKPYEGVMYVVTSSETLPPLLDMEVPVEAINQNLAGFIK